MARALPGRPVRVAPEDEETRAWAVDGVRQSWLSQILYMAGLDLAGARLDRETRERFTRALHKDALRLWPDDVVEFRWA